MARTSKNKSKKPTAQTGPKTLGKRHAFAIATMMMIAFLTFSSAFAIIGYSALKYRYIGDGPLSAEHVFEVPKGAGLSRVANALASSGAIDSATIFKLSLRD
jgi:cell division protein YceG involved in septum cleavage